MEFLERYSNIIEKHSMRVLILAGGFATRLWPLTEHRAKPLVPLAGKPMLSHLIEKIPKDIPLFLSTNFCFSEDFRKWQIDEFPQRNIQIVVEDSQNEREKKGALSAVIQFLEEFPSDEDLCVLAGDNYFGTDFQNFFDFFVQNPKIPAIAAHDIQDKIQASLFGVIVPRDEEYIDSFEEKPETPLSTLISTGAYIFPRSSFAMLSSYAKQAKDDLGGIFEYFLSHGTAVRYFSFLEKWFDVGSFPAFLEANKFLIGKSTIKGKEVLENQVEYKGSVFLGNGVRLSNVFLEDSIVLSNTTIKNAVIRKSIIGENVFLVGIDLEQKIIRDESYLIGEETFPPIDGSAPYSGENEPT
jgi:glucose-1-phosphate thymidylyltransferase